MIPGQPAKCRRLGNATQLRRKWDRELNGPLTSVSEKVLCITSLARVELPTSAHASRRVRALNAHSGVIG